MGFFNSIFKSLGFENANETQKKVEEEVDATAKYNKFNLHNNRDITDKNPSTIYPKNISTVNLNSLVVYAPTNHAEVQTLVDCLAKNEACIVNLGGIAQKDQDRILDFLSGAIYALNGTIKRLQGDLFILAPKGIEVKSL